MNFSADGALANAASYCSVRGLGGAISFLGTNTGTSLSRCIADNGQITFDSNTATMGTILAIAAREDGSINVNNNAFAQDIRYCQAGSRGRLSIRQMASAAACYGVEVFNGGLLDKTLAALATYDSVVRQGTILHNGGTLRRAIKEMNGTLTTGSFNQTDIQHRVAVSKVLLASNTAKADYQGLAAQLI
jgi:hypothetical protein